MIFVSSSAEISCPQEYQSFPNNSFKVKSDFFLVSRQYSTLYREICFIFLLRELFIYLTDRKKLLIIKSNSYELIIVQNSYYL